MAQAWAAVQNHPLYTIGGLVSTLKGGEIWLEHGAPLPGYGPLRISSAPNKQSPISAPAPANLPSLPVPDLDIPDHYGLSSSPDAHLVVRNHAQLSGLGSQPFYIENQTLNNAFQIYNSTNIVGGPPLADAHLSTAACVTTAVGVAAFAGAVCKFFNRNKKNIISTEQLVAYL